MYSFSRLQVAVACLALWQFLPCEASAQVLAHRDFDIEQFEGGVNSQGRVDQSAAVEEIAKETNKFREEHDRGKLRTNKKLAKTAQEFAEYMARTDRYGHQADGREPAE